MNIILDACAIIAFLRDEEGGDVVENFLIDSEYSCYIHAMNFIRSDNQVYADQMINQLELAGVIFNCDPPLNF